MITNRRLVTFEGTDFYPTPSWGTIALLKYVRFTGSILEPCCGKGAMAEVIRRAGYKVHASDIVNRGYGRVRDFLSIKQAQNVITNSPFNVAEELLQHALDITDRKICFLLRMAFLESKRRYEKFYRCNPPKQLLVFSERLSMYPENCPVVGGGTTSYAWFIWDNRSKEKQTTVQWIAPGLKSNVSAAGQHQGV